MAFCTVCGAQTPDGSTVPACQILCGLPATQLTSGEDRAVGLSPVTRKHFVPALPRDIPLTKALQHTDTSCQRVW